MFNPYFTEIVNPAYVDVVDCPYLNYAKSPSPIENQVEPNNKYKVPDTNVKAFIDSLEQDWDTLDESTKKEYEHELGRFLSKNVKIENFNNKTDSRLDVSIDVKIIVAIIILVLMIIAALKYKK